MNKIKKILFAIVLIMLILPSLQNRFNIFNIKPLDGDFILLEKPVYSKAGWKSGIFQTQYNDWLEENIGFRNFFVRTNNQLDYSLYRLAHAEGVIVGKKDVLYEYDYIRAYLGDDFIGKRTLDKKMRRLKYMQEYLKREKDIQLLFILEPSKARFEPEFIPNNYNIKNRSISNYEYIVELAEKYDITYLDLNEHFLQMKDTASYPLYPQYGVHWSTYGMSLAIDTLVSFIEYQTKFDLPAAIVTKTEITKKLKDTDYDAGKPLNLLWVLPHQKMAYPEFRFEENPGNEKPNLLTVADSYYWNIYNTQLPFNLFSDASFWYFNAQAYTESFDDPSYVKDLNLKTEVEKQDLILLMVTERFLFKYDWRFIDNIYELYVSNIEPDYHYRYENDVRTDIALFEKMVQQSLESELTLEEIIHREAGFLFASDNLPKYIETYGPAYYINMITNDTSWMKGVVIKAEEKNISVEEMIKLDADYMFKTEYPQIFEKYYGIRKNEENIRNNPEWMETIKQKAAQYWLTIDEMIHQDAIWLYNN